MDNIGKLMMLGNTKYVYIKLSSDKDRLKKGFHSTQRLVKFSRSFDFKLFYSLMWYPDIENSFANIRIFGRDMTNSENPLFAPPYNIRHTLLIKPLMEFPSPE